MEGGFILINKPKGMTSHDVVNFLRKITEIKKIGHGGTLDPSAEGLLILAIKRKATKNLSYFKNLPKEYLAEIKLGEISNTYNGEGEIKKIKKIKIPSLKKIKNVLQKFEGEIFQKPPPFSAKKIKGIRAYKLARKGIKVRLKPTKVKIFKISLLEYNWPILKIKVNCSAGTYIRSLANDIGKKLSCGAYLKSLKRIKIGNFSLKEAIKLSEINKRNWKKYLIWI